MLSAATYLSLTNAAVGTAVPVAVGSFVAAALELRAGGDGLVPLKFDFAGAPHQHVTFVNGVAFYAACTAGTAIGARMCIRRLYHAEVTEKEARGLAIAAFSLGLATPVLAYSQYVGVRVARGAVGGMSPVAVWSITGGLCAPLALSLLLPKAEGKAVSGR